MPSNATDVVLVFPPAQGNVGAFRTHLGVAYLRAVLARDGIDAVQYLNPRPGSVDQVADDILSLKPRVAGFTVYDANFSLSLALARNLKRKRPEVRVVFGGPSATFCAEHILPRHRAVDACVRGEAEETGPRIFARLLDEAGLDEPMLGVAFRRNGEIVDAGLPPLVGSTCRTLPPQSALDSTPSPYLSGVLADARPGILSGRGCTHQCQYCCFATLGRKTLRLHSTERVMAELEWAAAHQARSGERYVVAIHDDAFTLSPTRAKSLCQAIADRNLGLVLSCITRADALDEELIRMMREAGFVGMAFGLESAVPSVLRATGKVRPPDWPDPDLSPEREFVEKVRSSVLAAKRHGMNVGLSIILGLPSETAEDAAETLRFVKGLPIDYYMHNFLWVFPGTPLWDTHRQYGIRCEINEAGLGATTEYAYDVARLRPRPRCSLEDDARLERMMARDALYGCGAPSSDFEGSTAVAVVRGTALAAETAQWLSGLLDVGGLVVQVYPPLARGERDWMLHCDRAVAGESLMPARHHLQLVPKVGADGEQRWMVCCSGSDLYCTHKPELLTFRASDGPGPLLDYLAGHRTECSLCDASGCLRRPDGLARFAEGAAEGAADGAAGGGLGERMLRMPVPPAIVYPGRWTTGKAPCLSLSRIEIDQTGHVRCCRQGDAIGVVGDARDMLVGRLAALEAEVERRRGCAGCPSTRCPRCPFPGMADEEYCNIVRRQEQALDVLTWVHTYSRIPSILAAERDRVGSG